MSRRSGWSGWGGRWRWLRHPVLVVVVCIASVLAVFLGLARVTSMTLELERSERAALERATQEENVRIALWRLDAIMAELLANENTRSAQRFRQEDEATGLPAPLVQTRFELAHDGAVRSQPSIETPDWIADLPTPDPPPPAPPAPRPRREPPPPIQEPDLESEQTPTARAPWALQNQAEGVLTDRINVGGNESGQQTVFTQDTLNTQAFQRRQELGTQATFVRPPADPPGVEVETAFEPRWLGGELVLVRRVRRGDETLLQGTWLDWEELRDQWLLDLVEPVVPGSRLEPVEDPEAEPAERHPGRRMALLPAHLVPGPSPETEPRDWTPVRWTLAAAWGAALLGLAGLGSLLYAVFALGRRRATFVSAVTHELRTPLTTFRLYTDLLARGAVPADETPEYLDTLDREAGRLDHLVDNVLAFSGLERRPVRSATVPLGALLEEHVPELVERAERKGFVLQVATAPEHADVPVRAETTSVGRILANLVDNATKYAADAKPRELLLDTAVRRRHVVLALRDHGPGIDPAERRRIFRPFHRSAGQAAGSAPGVGLGLALARRLARSMGGDLQLTSADHDGARFELTLRRARCRPEDSPERSHDPQETTP